MAKGLGQCARKGAGKTAEGPRHMPVTAQRSLQKQRGSGVVKYEAFRELTDQYSVAHCFGIRTQMLCYAVALAVIVVGLGPWAIGLLHGLSFDA